VNRHRLARLLIGHALHEGKPAHEVLAQAGLQPSMASLHLKAGRLQAGLRSAGFSDDLAELAVAWPAALRGSQRQLTEVQPRLPRTLPLAATTGMLAIFGLLQKGVGALLRLKVDPLFLEIAATATGSTEVAHTPTLEAGMWAGAGLTVVALLVGTVGVARRLGPAALRGKRENTLRQTILATALLESHAPPAVRRAALAGTPGLSTADPRELGAIGRHALAGWHRQEHRLLLFVRTVGYLGLSLYAGALCARIYLSLARLAALG